MKFSTLACAAIIGVAAVATPAFADTDPSGIWLTQAGDARVHVSQCSGGICGRVVWLREPNDRNGQPLRDDKNANPSLAQRPIVGLPIFSGLQPVAANRWSGRIYNADDGQTYAANVTYPGGATLEVQGCMGALCGGETWNRVSGPVASGKKKSK